MEIFFIISKLTEFFNSVNFDNTFLDKRGRSLYLGGHRRFINEIRNTGPYLKKNKLMMVLKCNGTIL